jgi:hypothetical protein
MPHRNMRDTLREERERILNGLAALEVQVGPDAEARRGDLLLALDRVRSSLEQITPKRPLPVLASLTLVRGCSVSWDAMVGTARVRNCGVCEREVFDLTALDPEEIEAFLSERREKLPCMRLYVRPDGRYQEGPCAPARRRLFHAAAAAALLGLVGLAAYMSSEDEEHARSCSVPPHHNRGELMMMGEFRASPSPPTPIEREPFGWEAAHPTPPPPVPGGPSYY